MFSSVVSNVLTKGRIRLRAKKKCILIAKIIAVIVEGKSKGETLRERSYYIHTGECEKLYYKRVRLRGNERKRRKSLSSEQISKSSFI